MNTVVWHSNKSLLMNEVRIALKKKSQKGQPPISNKEANRTWREDILGVFSEEQKKAQRKEKTKKKEYDNN